MEVRREPRHEVLLAPEVHGPLAAVAAENAQRVVAPRLKRQTFGVPPHRIRRARLAVRPAVERVLVAPEQAPAGDFETLGDGPRPCVVPGSGTFDGPDPERSRLPEKRGRAPRSSPRRSRESGPYVAAILARPRPPRTIRLGAGVLVSRHIHVAAAASPRLVSRPGRASGPRRRRDGSTARIQTSPKAGTTRSRTRRDVAAARRTRRSKAPSASLEGAFGRSPRGRRAAGCSPTTTSSRRRRGP